MEFLRPNVKINKKLSKILSTLYEKLHCINTCYNNTNSFMFSVSYIKITQNLAQYCDVLVSEIHAVF